MSARSSAALYTPDILALAVELADYPLTVELAARGEANARVCGSSIMVGVAIGPRGAIERIGARVTACAIGQAAAALFLRSAQGHDADAIASALAGIEAWLAHGGDKPAWPGLKVLAGAQPYPARHPAILLPWKAALAALSNAAAAD